MSRFHFIKLASPADARRFAGYLSKPGAKLMVNAKKNVMLNPLKGMQIDSGSVSYKPHDNRWGWLQAALAPVEGLEKFYRDSPGLMIAIAVPVS